MIQWLLPFDTRLHGKNFIDRIPKKKYSPKTKRPKNENSQKQFQIEIATQNKTFWAYPNGKEGRRNVSRLSVVPTNRSGTRQMCQWLEMVRTATVRNSKFCLWALFREFVYERLSLEIFSGILWFAIFCGYFAREFVLYVNSYWYKNVLE